MTSRRNTTTAKQIERARLTIEGTLASPDIQTAVTPFGYPVARMEEGKNLLGAVLASRGNAETRRSVKKSASAGAKSATEDAYQSLAPLVKIARAVLPASDLALGALGLDRGQLPRSRAALLDAGRRFLNALAADAALAGRLETYGVTLAKRSAAQAALAALERAQTVQTGAKGAAEDAAPTARESLDALNNWVMQYRKIARVALSGHPQLLEKLGIGVAS